MDRENRDFPLSWQTRLPGLNRTGLYYVPAPLSKEELLLRRWIDEIHTGQPCYGSRRMQAVLSQAGLTVSRKRIQRLMRDMGILAIYPGPKLSGGGDESPRFPYLLRGVDIDHPNHTRGTDITYGAPVIRRAATDLERDRNTRYPHYAGKEKKLTGRSI